MGRRDARVGARRRRRDGADPAGRHRRPPAPRAHELLRAAAGPAGAHRTGDAHPLRAAAAEFANDSEDRGCRKYSVTVVPEAGPVTLYDGFRLLWRRSEAADAGHADDQQLFGPQPDIWIPSSTAEYDFIPKGPGQTTAAKMSAEGAPGKGDPVFRVRGSAGTSPLVLALFTKAHESVADPIAAPIAPSTGALLQRVADAG